MEELSKIAMAHYQASSDHLQKLARDFFGAMDDDDNGKIDLREFLEFMEDEGYGQMTNPFIFNQLDLDGNGTLDFEEVMTVYYIIKSGRPFCDHCRRFITSTYLKCVGCLEDPNGVSFYLCLDCYITQKCDHTHNGLSRFLDNYSLVEVLTNLKFRELGSSGSRSRIDPISVPSKPQPGSGEWDPSTALVQVPQGPPVANQQHWWSQSSAPVTPPAPAVHNHTWIQNSYSYNHVPPPPKAPQRLQQWHTALGALNTAVHIGVVGSSLCTIL